MTFFRLEKISAGDAAGYVAAQFAGGISGIVIALGLFGGLPADPSVNYVATVPGAMGPAVAFLAELAISFCLMSVVLRVSNTPSIAPLTGICAGLFVAASIVFEAPLSGMSMNPARTLGSNLLAHTTSTLGLLHGAAVRHAPRRRGLRPKLRPCPSALRKAPPHRCGPLHFWLQ